jgi:hypothetical protein
MAIPTPPDGANKEQLMAWLEMEANSGLYDPTDLAELQARLLVTRDLPEYIPPTEE